MEEQDSASSSQDEVAAPGSTPSSSSRSCSSSFPLVYSSRSLKALRDAPSSRTWPPFLDAGFASSGSGVWDPHAWHRGVRKDEEEAGGGESPLSPERSSNNTANSNANAKEGGSLLERRKEDWRSFVELPMRKDVKERLKDVADDGIILSPQRRSFLSGCHAPLSNQASSNGEEKNNNSHGNHRRDDREELLHHGSGKNQGQNQQQQGGGNHNNGRWTGRTLHHHNNSNSGGGNSNHHHHHNNSNKRFGRQDYHHMRRHHRESEPEWMSASISHGDVMELRGFDDDINQQKLDASANAKNGRPPSSSKVKNILKASPTEAGRPASSGKKDSGALTTDPTPATKPCDSLQIMDILDLSQMPDFSNSLLPESLSNGSETATTKKESRFSKFFQNRNQDESLAAPSSQQQTVSVQLAATTNPPQRTLIRIPSPGDSKNYFAPISPAAPTKSSENQQTQQQHPPRRTAAASSASLMEMLRLGGAENGKAALLEEEISKSAKSNNNNNSAWNSEPPPPHHHHITQSSYAFEQQHQQQPEEKSNGAGDLSAFKKFAALVQGSQDNDNLPQPLRHHAQPLPPQLQVPGFGLLRPSPIPANAPTENDILLANRYPPVRHRFPPQQFPPQQQQPQQPRVFPGELQASPLPPPNNFYEILQCIQRMPFSPDILKRPEVSALQAGLARGEINHLMLLQQLTQGNHLNDLRKLIVLNVLKVEQMSGKLSFPPPPVPVPPPPHVVMPPQMISPFHLAGDPALLKRPPNGGGGEPPSPEMIHHHQQQLLMGRKEGKKEEQHKKAMVDEGGSGPSPLVFTPTVVIKRMAADRRDSDPPSRPQEEPAAAAATSSGGAFKRLFGGSAPGNGSHCKEEGLSRFFTPDVLAQASSGNMPSMPPLPTKKALTLEELENLQLV